MEDSATEEATQLWREAGCRAAGAWSDNGGAGQASLLHSHTPRCSLALQPQRHQGFRVLGKGETFTHVVTLQL